MRVVVYDDESLEPITVLNLPLTEREMLQRRVWRVPVPAQIHSYLPPSDDLSTEMLVVDLEFEPFVRRKFNGTEQRSVFCFTKADSLAMLLNPAWLPGQRRAIDYLEQQNDALTAMLMRAW